MHLGKSAFFKKCHSLPLVIINIAGKAGDKIRRQRGRENTGAEAGSFRKIHRLGALAVHSPEHIVAAGLEREMKNAGRPCLSASVRQKSSVITIGLRGAKPYAHIGRTASAMAAMTQARPGLPGRSTP